MEPSRTSPGAALARSGSGSVDHAEIAKFEAVAAEKKSSFYPFAVERNTLAFGKHARRLIDMFCINSLLDSTN